MAVLGTTDIGPGICAVTVDHDPTTVATDAPRGCLIVRLDTGQWYRKTDDGSTTSVVEVAP